MASHQKRAMKRALECDEQSTSAAKHSKGASSSGWCESDYVREQVHCAANVSSRLCELFATDHTVPFIARYRQHVIGGMEAAQVRQALHAYNTAKSIKASAQKVLKQIGEQLTGDLTMRINDAKSMLEIESLFAPFKPESKRTRAGKARALGLLEPAERILMGHLVDLQQYMDTHNTDLDSLDKVCACVQDMIVDCVLKHADTHSLMRKLAQNRSVQLTATSSKSKKMSDEDKEKYKNYFDFKIYVGQLQSHQILAINRGEEKKALSVKLILPDYMEHDFLDHVTKQLGCAVKHTHRPLVQAAANDAYKRLFCPQLHRLIRSELETRAECESLSVFARNLRQVLLAAPCRSAPVLGLDPGFAHGCEIVFTGKVYLSDGKQHQTNQQNAAVVQELGDVLGQLGTARLLVAVGNGCGSRQAQCWLTQLIHNKTLGHNLNVQFTVVSENGASIYSVSELAEKELPLLHPHFRSAVSIARRLLDPLAELVKIEPKHLGVGMYQHDLNEKLLSRELDEVVEECVSFVGVDLNTASVELLQLVALCTVLVNVLRRVAGLNRTVAERLVGHRTKLGSFTNRLQLMQVKGLGPKSFEQCAGFVRISHIQPQPQSTSAHTAAHHDLKDADAASVSKSKSKKTSGKSKLESASVCHLDATSVHPESYEIAHALLAESGCSTIDVGTEHMRNALNRLTDQQLHKLTSTLDCARPVLQSMLKALAQPLNYDIRASESAPPVLRSAALDLSDVRVNQELNGVVSNVTSFGAFIDLAVGQDALLHVSKLKRGVSLQQLTVGAAIRVKVVSIDLGKKRIGVSQV